MLSDTGTAMRAICRSHERWRSTCKALEVGKHCAPALRVKSSAHKSSRQKCVQHPTEDLMPTFMISMNWTDQGIRTIKDAKKRLDAARDLAKKVGVEIKQVWLTNGESDLVSFVEAANGDNVAKFVLALGSYGNVHTRTNRARSEQEY